jgi:hypothetical protein
VHHGHDVGKALFGLRDFEVGDEAFDRAVRVKTDDAAAARAALVPVTRTLGKA